MMGRVSGALDALERCPLAVEAEDGFRMRDRLLQLAWKFPRISLLPLPRVGSELTGHLSA